MPHAACRQADWQTDKAGRQAGKQSDLQANILTD